MLSWTFNHMLVQLQYWYLIDFNENMKQKFQEKNSPIIRWFPSLPFPLLEILSSEIPSRKARKGFNKGVDLIEKQCRSKLISTMTFPNMCWIQTWNFFRHFFSNIPDRRLHLDDLHPGDGPPVHLPSCQAFPLPKSMQVILFFIREGVRKRNLSKVWSLGG